MGQKTIIGDLNVVGNITQNGSPLSSAVYPFTITVAQMQAAMEAPVSLSGFPAEMSEGVTTVALSIVQEADPEQGIAEDTLMAVVPLTIEFSVGADPTTQEIVNKRIWVGMLGADSSGVSANVKFMIDGGSLTVLQGGASDGYLVAEWKPGTGYPAFWFVRHEGLLYMSLESINDNEWISSHWSSPVGSAYEGVTQSALNLLILINNAAIDASRINSGSAASGQVLTANGNGGVSWQTPASPGMANPMTASGDMIYGGAGGSPSRIAKGSAGQVLTMKSDGSAPEWQTPAAPGMANPMSAAGDIIVGGTSGSPAKLAKGTAGQVLTIKSDGSAPEWQTPSGGGTGIGFDGEVTCFASNSGIFTMREASAQSIWDTCSAEYTASGRRSFIFKVLGSSFPGNGLCFVYVASSSSFDPSISSINITCWWYTNMQQKSLTERPTGDVVGFTSTKLNNPMSAVGDLIVGGTNGALEKLTKGSIGQVLSVNDYGTGLEWKTVNPMTAQDDVIVGGESGAPARLAKGSNHQLLGVNGSGHVGYVSGLPYSTSVPTSANTEGDLKIVVLASEPATKYDGYLYIITGE